MSYVINQNFADKKAKIHKADCPFAQPPGHKVEHGEWHGPYETLAEAMAEQKKLAEPMGADIGDTCKHCM